MHRRLLPILLALVAALLVQSTTLATPRTSVHGSDAALAVADEVLFEDWQVVRIAGADSGYVHTTITRSTEGDEILYVVDADSRMKMNRMGAVIDVVTTQRSVENAAGELVRIDSSITMSNRPTATRVDFSDGVAHLKTTVMGETRELEVDVPPDTLGPYWLGQRAWEYADQPGARFQLTTWGGDTNSPTTVDVHMVGREDVIVGGEKLSLVRYETTLEAAGGVTTSNWADESGNPVKTSTSMMGMTIETLRCDESTARAAYAAGGDLSPDVFRASVVVSSEYLPSARSVDAAEIRLTPRSARVKFDDVADSRQTVGEAAEDGSILVRIERRTPPAERNAPRPLVDVPAELERPLASSSMIQSNHPDIVGIANEIVTGETDAWRATQRIEAWVEKNVTEKGMDVGFASALEVCTDRAGDCTEHAVLLCALARAAGIPSRVAMGLLYIGGIWGGHAWTEVWIDGDWYPVDGTIGSGSVDALHLTLARLDLAEGSPMADFAGLASTIGELDIAVQSLRVGARTIDLTEGELVRDENGRYVNEVWGIAFDMPAGWDVDPKRPSADIGFEILEMDGRTPDNKKVSIELEARDPVYARELASLLRAPSMDDLERFEVDGRTAWYHDGEGLVRIPRHIAIVDTDRVFVLHVSRVDGDAQLALLDELLASIDLDVGRD
jgi:hypothetical protein